jgi:hypothetical protein
LTLERAKTYNIPDAEVTQVVEQRTENTYLQDEPRETTTQDKPTIATAKLDVSATREKASKFKML